MELQTPPLVVIDKQKAQLWQKLDAVRYSEFHPSYNQQPGHAKNHPQGTSSSSYAAQVLLEFEMALFAYRDDEGTKEELVEMGMPQLVMNTARLVTASSSSNSSTTTADGEACKSAVRILRCCLTFAGSSPMKDNNTIVEESARLRAIDLLKQGVFSFVSQLTQTAFRCHDTIELCLLVMLKMFQRLPQSEVRVLSEKALKDIIRVSVFHGSSANIYLLSCKLFAVLLIHASSNFSLKVVPMGLQQSISQYVFEGIRLHKSIGKCQDHGRALLQYLVGPERATQMIQQVYSTSHQQYHPPTLQAHHLGYSHAA